MQALIVLNIELEKRKTEGGGKAKGGEGGGKKDSLLIEGGKLPRVQRENRGGRKGRKEESPV